jgi:S-adenosylmethionine decarboxylase
MESPIRPTDDPLSFMAFVGSATAARPSGFEGPEKRLEIIVAGAIELGGFRLAPQSKWAQIIAILKAQIVSKVSNEFVDAYVLTESSLFVFANKVILITCGTTVLLHALPAILELVRDLELCVEWASFMRKNFSYPWAQIGPHESMETEYTLLKSHLPLGRPFIFGPVDSDHYFMFVYDDIRRPAVEDDAQLSLTMYDFDEQVAQVFFSDRFICGNETQSIRDKSGVQSLVEGWTVQDLQFAPCGYSINAIKEETYQTMHITPESHCSFASYETNSKSDAVPLMVEKVLQVFRPMRFSMMLLVDPHSAIGVKLNTCPSLDLDKIQGYTVNNTSENEFAPGYKLINANFTSNYFGI